MTECSYCAGVHEPLPARTYVPKPAPRANVPPAPPYVPLRARSRPYAELEHIDFLVNALTPDHLARLREEPAPNPWTTTQARVYVRRLLRQPLAETKLFAHQLAQQAVDDRAQLPLVKVARVVDPDLERVIPFNFDQFDPDEW